MKRSFLLAVIVGALFIAPARAVTCQDGLAAIESMSRVMELTAFEQANIEALITKARLENDKGKQRNCKLILADAIRFFLIKSVIQ